MSAETGHPGHDDATKYQVKATRDALAAVPPPAPQPSCTFGSPRFDVTDGLLVLASCLEALAVTGGWTPAQSQ